MLNYKKNDSVILREREQIFIDPYIQTFTVIILVGRMIYLLTFKMLIG